MTAATKRFEELVRNAVALDCPSLTKFHQLALDPFYRGMSYVSLTRLVDSLVAAQRDFLSEIGSMTRGLTEWRRWQTTPCPQCKSTDCLDAPHIKFEVQS